MSEHDSTARRLPEPFASAFQGRHSPASTRRRWMRDVARALRRPSLIHNGKRMK